MRRTHSPYTLRQSTWDETFTSLSPFWIQLSEISASLHLASAMIETKIASALFLGRARIHRAPWQLSTINVYLPAIHSDWMLPPEYSEHPSAVFWIKYVDVFLWDRSQQGQTKWNAVNKLIAPSCKRMTPVNRGHSVIFTLWVTFISIENILFVTYHQGRPVDTEWIAVFLSSCRVSSFCFLRNFNILACLSSLHPPNCLWLPLPQDGVKYPHGYILDASVTVLTETLQEMATILMQPPFVTM